MSFENGYYITDILDVMDALDKTEAERMLSDLSVYGAANGGMDEEGLRRFTDSLRRQAGLSDESNDDTLDKDGLQALRSKIRK